MFVVSYRTAHGWIAVTKDFLTEVLGAGNDAKVAGLPAAAAGTLVLMCPGLASRPACPRRKQHYNKAGFVH